MQCFIAFLVHSGPSDYPSPAPCHQPSFHAAQSLSWLLANGCFFRSTLRIAAHSSGTFPTVWLPGGLCPSLSHSYQRWAFHLQATSIDGYGAIPPCLGLLQPNWLEVQMILALVQASACSPPFWVSRAQWPAATCLRSVWLPYPQQLVFPRWCSSACESALNFRAFRFQHLFKPFQTWLCLAIKKV